MRFAENVWNIQPEGKSDKEIALAGLDAMENWMRELGVAMNLTELGATEEMLDDLVNATIILDGGYKVLTKEDIRKIFKQSF